MVPNLKHTRCSLYFSTAAIIASIIIETSSQNSLLTEIFKFFIMLPKNLLKVCSFFSSSDKVWPFSSTNVIADLF